MSIEGKRREAFENFVVEFHRGASLDCERHNDPECPHLNGQLIYEDWNVQSAWAAWNAALDSLEIELPTARDVSHDEKAVRTIEDCRAAIEACGLKVKV